MTRSRFEEGRGGHYVKSRAVRADIASSSFDDLRGEATNYMIDLPEGAVGQISNNWFVQGRNKENYSAFIAVAAEGETHPSGGLSIVANDARRFPGRVARFSVRGRLVGPVAGDRREHARARPDPLRAALSASGTTAGRASRSGRDATEQRDFAGEGEHLEILRRRARECAAA